MSAWESFFVAEPGAAAVLAGLIFVSVSINLREILAEPDLADGALEALILLLGVPVAGSLLLVPEQDLRIIALEVAGVGLLMWGWVSRLQWKNRSQLTAPYRQAFLVRVVLGQVAALPFILAGPVVAEWEGSTGWFLVL